jgi:hypothetical protein
MADIKMDQKYVLHGSEAVLYMANQAKKKDTTKNDLKNDKAIAQLPAVDHLVKSPKKFNMGNTYKTYPHYKTDTEQNTLRF